MESLFAFLGQGGLTMFATQAIENCRDEYTFLLCECCFDLILEDDAEYHKELPYCHHCIEEVQS